MTDRWRRAERETSWLDRLRGEPHFDPGDAPDDSVSQEFNELKPRDRALLWLAYVEEQKPVTDAMVQSALDDLKGLPQHWNDVAPAPGEVDGACEAEVALSAAGQDAPGRESPTVEYQRGEQLSLLSTFFRTPLDFKL